MLRVTARDRIVTIPAQGMASPDPFGGQPGAFYCTVFLKRLKRIGRAGWLIATVEPNPGAENQPIGMNGQRQDAGKG